MGFLETLSSIGNAIGIGGGAGNPILGAGVDGHRGIGGGGGGGKGIFDILSSPNVLGGILQGGLGAFSAVSQADAQREIAELQQQALTERQQMADEAALERLLFQLGVNSQTAAGKAKLEGDIAKQKLIQEAFANLIQATQTGGTNTTNALQAIATLGQKPLV